MWDSLDHLGFIRGEVATVRLHPLGISGIVREWVFPGPHGLPLRCVRHQVGLEVREASAFGG